MTQFHQAIVLQGLILITTFGVSCSKAEARTPYLIPCLDIDAAAAVRIADYNDSHLQLSKMDIGKVDEGNLSPTIFRIDSIRGSSSRSKYPFLKNPETVKKLRDQLKKGVPIFLTPRCEKYNAMVLFPETAPHKKLSTLLGKNESVAVPMIFLTVSSREDEIVHELVHVEQAYERFDDKVFEEFKNILDGGEIARETNFTSEESDALSFAFFLLRELPAYSVQVGYLLGMGGEDNIQSAKMHQSGRSGMSYQFMLLDQELLRITNSKVVQGICELINKRTAELQNLPFVSRLQLKACAGLQP